jgi:hypothetical protein
MLNDGIAKEDVARSFCLGHPDGHRPSLARGSARHCEHQGLKDVSLSL